MEEALISTCRVDNEPSHSALGGAVGSHYAYLTHRKSLAVPCRYVHCNIANQDPLPHITHIYISQRTALPPVILVML